jgi:hypothetical protein
MLTKGLGRQADSSGAAKSRYGTLEKSVAWTWLLVEKPGGCTKVDAREGDVASEEYQRIQREIGEHRLGRENKLIIPIPFIQLTPGLLKWARGISELHYQVSTPWTHKSLILQSK